MSMRQRVGQQEIEQFLSVFGPISDPLRPRRHRLKAWEYRALRQERCEV